MNNQTNMTTEQFLETIARFYQDNLETTKRKNADYAGVGDPFKNFKVCEAIGITTVEKGILVRMTDKMSRISTLLNSDAQVKDETITDTLKDLANYSMILAVYIDNKNKCDKIELL